MAHGPLLDEQLFCQCLGLNGALSESIGYFEPDP